MEIILVDDGSTDDTARLIDELAQHDSRIRAVHTANQGVSQARNTGMGEARGAFMVFVDGDDRLAPGILHESLQAQRRSGAQMVMFGHADVNVSSEGESVVEYSIPQDMSFSSGTRDTEFYENMYRLEKARYLFSCWGKLIERKWAGDLLFEEGVSYGEDTSWVLSLLQLPGRIIAINAIGYYYRVNNTGLLNSCSESKARSIIAAHKSQIPFYEWDKMPSEYVRLAKLRLTNDVCWALQALLDDRTLSQDAKIDSAKVLSQSPYRKLYLSVLKQASSSRMVKVLFLINSISLWKLVL